MSGEQPRTGVLADMVRAAVVAANALLALLTVATFVAAVVTLVRSSSPGGEDVFRRIGAYQVAILAVGGAATVVALAQAVRLWWRGSWHVITVLLGTLSLLAALAVLLFYSGGMGQR